MASQPDHPRGDCQPAATRDCRRPPRSPQPDRGHDPQRGQDDRRHPTGDDQPAGRPLPRQAQHAQEHAGRRQAGRGQSHPQRGPIPRGDRPVPLPGLPGRTPGRRHEPAQRQDPEQEALDAVIQVRRGHPRRLPGDELAQVHELDDVALVEPAPGRDLREQLQRQDSPAPAIRAGQAGDHDGRRDPGQVPRLARCQRPTPTPEQPVRQVEGQQDRSQDEQPMRIHPDDLDDRQQPEPSRTRPVVGPGQDRQVSRHRQQRHQLGTRGKSGTHEHQGRHPARRHDRHRP